MATLLVKPQAQLWLALLLSLAAAPGCGGPAPLPPPALDASAAAEQALAEYDTNSDGILDAAELKKSPGLQGALSTLDANHDGRLAGEEIQARVAAMRASRAALKGVNAVVTLDGRPLVGATLKLLPEKFMGSGVKPAAGVSRDGGICWFSIEGEEFPGVHPGIYRVEVSKLDASGKELVPAKYNLNTQLGVDTGDGSKNLQEGSSFMLKLTTAAAE